MHAPLKITADTSADRKLLKKLKAKGLIEFTYMNLENAKQNVAAGTRGWSDDNIPAFFTLNESTFADGDVLAPSNALNIEKELVRILGAKKQNLADRRQLLGHYYSGNDVFVTGDKGDISSNKDALAVIGIVVLFNDEIEEYAEKVAAK